MQATAPDFEIRLARDAADLRAAQKLRYQVFVQELGGDGGLVDHDQQLERDEYDPFYDHILLIDRACAGHPVVGVYRVFRSDMVGPNGQSGRFYSEGEYDLTQLKNTGRRLLELGRSCVHAKYRGGTAMMRLWNGLAEYVAKHDIEVLFGVASFHGTDIQALKQPLSYLHYRHLAPENLRVRAASSEFQRMDLLPEDQVDLRAAKRAVPPLIKAYLRLGGFVGEGVFIDRDFNTTDVCLIMDIAGMSARHRAMYLRGKDA